MNRPEGFRKIGRDVSPCALFAGCVSLSEKLFEGRDRRRPRNIESSSEFASALPAWRDRCRGIPLLGRPATQGVISGKQNPPSSPNMEQAANGFLAHRGTASLDAIERR